MIRMNLLVPVANQGLRTFLAKKSLTVASIRCCSSKRNDTDHFNEERVGHDKIDEEIVKSEILTAALNHVNKKGWNMASISAGAENLNLSDVASGIFEEYDLVRFFITKNNLDLEKELSQNPMTIRDSIEWRLSKVVPYVSRYSEALALATLPQNVPTSTRLLIQLSDSIAHHSLKDKSADISWYLKRMGIASIYVSTEMCLIQDNSPGFNETWKFLDRRVKDFETIRKEGFSPSSVPLPELMSAGFVTIQNILGRNARR